MIDGFSELSDANNEDIDPWLPNIPVMEPKIDIETAKYIVARVGDKFCELVQQEREAKSLAGDEGQFSTPSTACCPSVSLTFVKSGFLRGI